MPVVDDGKDDLFGDFGNDWLVGGTNEDHLWGGYGDDLLNGDDNHDTTLGTADPLANNTTDARDIGPTFADFLFGGAGRDVLYRQHVQRPALRLGGRVQHVRHRVQPVRQPCDQPQPTTASIDNLLYPLSKSDGADPTRGTGARQGEPYGEIALLDHRRCRHRRPERRPPRPAEHQGRRHARQEQPSVRNPRGRPLRDDPRDRPGDHGPATDSAGAEPGPEHDRVQGDARGQHHGFDRGDACLGRYGDPDDRLRGRGERRDDLGESADVDVRGRSGDGDRDGDAVDDTADEGAETVNLTLAAGTGYTVGTASSASGTIVDNDGALFAAEAPAGATADRLLTERALEAVVAQAKSAWREVMPNADFRGITVTIGALPGQLLGFTLGKTITIDPTAAGWGWSVIYPDSGAPRMDLLFTVMHELGHALGFVDDDPAQPVVMGRTLSAEIGLHATPRSRAMSAATARTFHDLLVRHESSPGFRWITSHARLGWISSHRPVRALERRPPYRAISRFQNRAGRYTPTRSGLPST